MLLTLFRDDKILILVYMVLLLKHCSDVLTVNYNTIFIVCYKKHVTVRKTNVNKAQ